MKKVDSVSGQDLREMFAAATNWLEKSAADIDALNVFPVPDGDTGTNMLLTMRSSVDEAYRAPDNSASAVAEAIAMGALMGARGNSGVILSQIFRGIARGLADKTYMDGKALAEALLLASETAYKGISNPVEGTILTVMRDTASAAQKQVALTDGNVIAVFEAAVDAAKESVAHTPNLLPVLREAGVVDAGGQGLYTLLEGILLYLRGEVDLLKSRKPKVIVSNISGDSGVSLEHIEDEVLFGYCTEFILRGENLNPDEIREKLKDEGESLIVVGDESTVKVHIHVPDPSHVIHYAVSLGTMHNVSIRNMDEQYEDFRRRKGEEKKPFSEIDIVAVVAGEGLAKIFRSLGASAIVHGGQTMNPSTMDILKVVEALPSDQVIILPNNKNVVLTAEQIQQLTAKKIRVLPTETIPQGIAALMVYDRGSDFDTVFTLMDQEKSNVKTIEITRATRSTQLNGLTIKKGSAIGLLDGELIATDSQADTLLMEMLAEIDLSGIEVISLYYGAEAKESDAEQLGAAIRQKSPSLEVEVMHGGQPYYDYIVAIE
jgi:DAK2 domain fusion protein YloV